MYTENSKEELQNAFTDIMEKLSNIEVPLSYAIQEQYGGSSDRFISFLKREGYINKDGRPSQFSLENNYLKLNTSGKRFKGIDFIPDVLATGLGLLYMTEAFDNENEVFAWKRW